MAKFSFNGMDELSASFEELLSLSDRERMGIIMPAAELLVEKQRQKLRELFTQRSGALAASITIREKADDSGAYAEIYLKGKHPGSGTGKRKRKDGRSNGRYSGSNAEVGYILEYGSPRIAPRHWMESANDEAEEEVVETMQNAWDDLITQKGL
ncbi:MAG: hypothetical protein J6V25_07770 [Oscillospiraceae bacterium]|nr:hypothetical protein [Oscillospiraceae bacterium]